jgi:type I restriction enzyme M protein
LLKDGHIDTVIGLPANLFFSTGIPVCILVLKRCKKSDDVLFINAAEHYEKGKRQNYLRTTAEMPNGEIGDIERIISAYQERPKEIDRYARRVSIEEIAKNDYNLNISRYVSTAKVEEPIDLDAVNSELKEIEKRLKNATDTHNEYLKELGLPPI